MKGNKIEAYPSPLLSLENQGSEPHPSLKAGSHRRPEYRNRRQMCLGAAQTLSGDVTQTQKLPRNHEPKERCEYPSAETVKLQKLEARPMSKAGAGSQAEKH